MPLPLPLLSATGTNSLGSTSEFGKTLPDLILHQAFAVQAVVNETANLVVQEKTVFRTVIQNTFSEDKTVKVRIKFDNAQIVDENVKVKLVELASKYKNFILMNFQPEDGREDLHAKLIVIDHKTALVGSANLTFKGMVMNHELTVKLTGHAAQTVGSLIDRLSKHPECKRIGI